MKIKLSVLLNITPALNELLEIKLPIKAAYRVQRLATKIGAEQTTANTMRNKLIEEFGGPAQGDKPPSIAPDSDNWGVFVEKLEALMAEEIDIDVEPIPLELLGDVQVSAATLMRMDVFLKE